MHVKKCKSCLEIKADQSFHWNGHGYRSAHCRDCVSHMRRGRETYKQRGYRKKASNPEKDRARCRVRDAVRYGKINKPEACPQCNENVEPKHMHAHHHRGYDFPLDVKWMCRWCHSAEHRLNE